MRTLSAVAKLLVSQKLSVSLRLSVCVLTRVAQIVIHAIHAAVLIERELLRSRYTSVSYALLNNTVMGS